jgi:hypothetical protein
VNSCNSYFSLFLGFFEVSCLFVSWFLNQYHYLLCVWEWINEWVDVCLEGEMCMCWLFIYICIHSHKTLRNVRVVFVFNTFESVWAPSDLISFSVVCVRMNEWMSRCVCLEREMCILIIHIYVFTHIKDWEMWELCLFSILLKVFEPLLILSNYPLCMCENEWMSE